MQARCAHSVSRGMLAEKRLQGGPGEREHGDAEKKATDHGHEEGGRGASRREGVGGG